MGITHLVKNHCVKTLKVDQKIIGWSLHFDYRWRFPPMVFSIYSIKNPEASTGAVDVLGDERMDLGVVRRLFSSS